MICLLFQGAAHKSAVSSPRSNRMPGCDRRLTSAPAASRSSTTCGASYAAAFIKAEVPLAEMFGYSTSLRSLSQGRATYTMEFKHYSEAPKNVAESIINQKAAA